MKTVTLPGGSGGGSKKLIIDPSVEICMFQEEGPDGSDGLVCVNYKWMANHNQDFWDDGYVKGKLKGAECTYVWQIATFALAFAFAVSLVLLLR